MIRHPINKVLMSFIGRPVGGDVVFRLPRLLGVDMKLMQQLFILCGTP